MVFLMTFQNLDSCSEILYWFLYVDSYWHGEDYGEVDWKCLKRDLDGRDW